MKKRFYNPRRFSVTRLIHLGPDRVIPRKSAYGRLEASLTDKTSESLQKAIRHRSTHIDK